MAKDHYAVLGIERDATLEDVRAAYRKAALRLHPDTYDGDPAEAEGKLRELIEAYRAVSRALDPANAAARAEAEKGVFDPSDFARKGYSAYYRDPKAEAEGTTVELFTRRLQPSRHETWTFMLLWILAVAVGVGVGILAAIYRTSQVGIDNLTTWDLVLAIVVGEVIYVALAAGAFVLVMLTRKLVKLTVQFAAGSWNFLPGARRDRDLPQHPDE